MPVYYANRISHAKQKAVNSLFIPEIKIAEIHKIYPVDNSNTKK